MLARSSACYLVDSGLSLDQPRRLTLYGGTYENRSTTPGTDVHSKGYPVFTVLGGSSVTLEAMQIKGANSGGYHPKLAFAGGIELEGTAVATIRSVTISNTFGDGITLAPLRGGADHRSGTIVAVPTQISIRDVTVDRAGRQGITLASASGVSVSDALIEHPGIDTFDLEADQANEGAASVTIDDCWADGGSIFFANGGAGGGRSTGHVTVERCTMARPEGGAAILVVRSKHSTVARGPFLFSDDDLWCGTSVYVACVQVSGGNVTVARTTLHFPDGTVHEAVYHGDTLTTLVFDHDSVRGYGLTGSITSGGSLRTTGGSWVPAR